MEKNQNDVVIIDDDQELLTVINQILKDEGIQTKTYTSTQFVGTFKSKENTVFLIDLWFRDRKDGILQIQSLQKKLASDKIILMSSDPTIQEVASSLKLKNYLRKPIDFDDLISKVKKAVKA